MYKKHTISGPVYYTRFDTTSAHTSRSNDLEIEPNGEKALNWLQTIAE